MVQYKDSAFARRMRVVMDARGYKDIPLVTRVENGNTILISATEHKKVSQVLKGIPSKDIIESYSYYKGKLCKDLTEKMEVESETRFHLIEVYA